MIEYILIFIYFMIIAAIIYNVIRWNTIVIFGRVINNKLLILIIILNYCAITIIFFFKRYNMYLCNS